MYSQFARWSLLWLLPDAIFGAFSQWLNGQQKVRPTIPITILFVFYNFAANYILVHGIGSWSGFGFIGCPIATATTKVLRGFALIYYICHVRKLHLECWSPWSWSSFGVTRLSEFMKQALPAATVGLVEQAQVRVRTEKMRVTGEESGDTDWRTPCVAPTRLFV